MRWICLAALVFVSGFAGADQVLELHFDEGTGEEAADTSGMENHGTLMGAEWVDGKYGSALSFDGTGVHVEVADSPSLQITDEMTVAAWVSFDMLGASGNHDAIVAKASTWSFITFKRSDPPYQFAWWDSIVKNVMPGESKWIVSDWVPDINTWYHLAVTMKSEDTLQFFQDGQLIKESEYPMTIPPGAGNAIWIGKGNGATETFDGAVDEVTIFNTALDLADLVALMDSPASVEARNKLSTVWGSLKQR